MSGGVHIEFDDLEQFADKCREAKGNVKHILREELTKVAFMAERYARQLAPYDTGELEASIHAGPLQSTGTGYVVYIGTNKEYATYVHELNSSRVGHKYDNGIKLENYYVGGRGERTRNKASVKGYLPGRKYLRNAIVLTDPLLNKAMQRVISRTFGGF